MYEPTTVKAALTLIDRDGFDSWKINLFQFVDDFRRSKNPSELVACKPDSSFQRIEALAASTVQRLCWECDLVPPLWVYDVEALSRPWFVSGVENLKAMALLESPSSFKLRNLFVLDNFLARA